MNSKKASAATTAVLDEDVILEIVLRLPFKCAIRCMVLNKSLFRLISKHKKSLVSSMYRVIEGSIFYRFNKDTFKRITPGSSKILSITICGSEFPEILDSCNGVFLLKFPEQCQIYVFNPITGETMPMCPLIDFKFRKLALAVELDAQTTFQFKLVVAETVFPSDVSVFETLWRFTVLDPNGGTSWLIKSPVELICDERCNYNQSVYVHGCMYYVVGQYQKIIEFDVEKEKARSIDWPEPEDVTGDALFSRSLDGLLQCAYDLEDEIEIQSYDQVKDVWQLKHKITNVVYDPWLQFFNGQRFLFVYSNSDSIIGYPQCMTQGELQVLCVYDISSNEWEKINRNDYNFNIYNRHTFFSFVPTLAKVSDKYLHDREFEFAEVFLRGLQRLVMQDTGDA